MNYRYNVDYINTTMSSRLQQEITGAVAVSYLLSDLLQPEISVFWILCQMFASSVQNAEAWCPHRWFVIFFFLFLPNIMNLKGKSFP